MNVTFYNGTHSDAVVLWLDYDGNEVCTIHTGPAIPAVPNHASHRKLMRTSPSFPFATFCFSVPIQLIEEASSHRLRTCV